MQKTLTVGYNDIVLIPAGATNIYVEELAATNNYLGNEEKCVNDIFFLEIF